MSSKVDLNGNPTTDEMFRRLVSGQEEILSELRDHSGRIRKLEDDNLKLKQSFSVAKWVGGVALTLLGLWVKMTK